MKVYLNVLKNLFIIHLQLLAKEQDVEDKSNRLKAAATEIENLKTELTRLRRYEDSLNNVQVSHLYIFS